jgi:hypothetical protein
MKLEMGIDQEFRNLDGWGGRTLVTRARAGSAKLGRKS